MHYDRHIYFAPYPGYKYALNYSHSWNNVIIDLLLEKLYQKTCKTFYCGILATLWILNMIAFANDWTMSRSAFVVNNNSPMAIVGAVNEVTFPFPFIPSLLVILIADSILVCSTARLRLSNTALTV